MSEKENIQLAEQAVAALNAHDLNRYLRLIDDSYVGESEISPEPVRGTQGARQFLERLFMAFPDLRIETEQIFASGDHVFHSFRATATHKGSFMGMPPTNKSASWRGCNTVEIRNGKAVRSRVYADHVSLLQQLGALSLPKATAAG